MPIVLAEEFDHRNCERQVLAPGGQLREHIDIAHVVQTIYGLTDIGVALLHAGIDIEPIERPSRL